MAPAPAPATLAPPHGGPASRRLSFAERRHAFNRDDDGFVQMGALWGIMSAVFAIVVGIIGVIVAVGVLSGMLPNFFASGADTVEAFENATIDGGGIADTTLDSFAIIIAILFAIAPVGLVFGIFTLVKLGKGKGAAS